MNHRERVITAVRHKEPDRVPMDLGGTVDSTMQAVVYRELRDYLNLMPGTTEVVDPYQQVARVEEDVLELLGIDVMPLFYEPRRWNEGLLREGSSAQFPAGFCPRRESDGSQVLLDEAGHIIARMPKDGHYFDPVYSPLADAIRISDIEKHIDVIENFDKPDFLDKSYEELALKAKELHDRTDYPIVGFFGGHLLQAALILRGWEAFFMDLMVNQKFATALLERLLEANTRRFEEYARTVALHVDIVVFEDDLGMQDRLLISPEIYRKMIKPFQKKLFDFVKSRSNVFVFFHSDGAVASLIPDFIEIGIDILNPVQVTCNGMDTGSLKREYGKDICFWGAGCDSQRILAFGSTYDVREEVKRRIDDLASGGGFVFAPIHNVQNGVPPENVVTMFETAIEYGVY
jgi:uroporphyrinogen decarboxylase